jgi:ABC-2 type transport system permease protein
VAGLFAWVAGCVPRTRYGALVAREARYRWRDARRRAGLITIAVVGVFVPGMMNLGGQALEGAARETSPAVATWSMIFIGTLAALSLVNQFGYDGSAYAAHLAAGVPGRTELHARVVAFSLYLVPLLAGIAVLLAGLLGRPGLLPTMLGGLAASYGAGVGINVLVSVLGAYALPETSNPFAVNSGGGAAKGLFGLVALAGSLAVSAPFLAAAALLGDDWTLVALPLGLGYGVGATLLGCYIGGDLLDRQGPELLQAVSARR